MEKFFHFSPEDLIRISLSAILVYFMVIGYIRIVGKRSTSQMNNFDWIVTVAIGSLVGSTIILKDISIIDGGFSIMILLGLQYLLTKLLCFFPSIKKIVKSSPVVLLHDGKYIKRNLLNERILKSEINSAIRENGVSDIRKVYLVVLETDARMSVILKENNRDSDYSALKDIDDIDEFLTK